MRPGGSAACLSVGELQELERVPVGIGEGRHPATPRLALRRPAERDPGPDEPRVSRTDVVDGEIDHDAERVARGSADLRVDTHGQADAA